MSEQHVWSEVEFCFSRWLECSCGFTAKSDEARVSHEDVGAWTGWTAQDNADVLLAKVDAWYEDADYGLTVEARGVCDTLRAERDEARLQLAAARSFAVSVVAKSLLRHEATCRCDWCALLPLLSAPLGAPEQVQG